MKHLDRVETVVQTEGIFKYTNEEYHSGPGLSSSHIKELLVSPAHYQIWLAQEKKQSEAMLLGSAVHAAVLEPKLFEETYVVRPDCGRCISMGYEKCYGRAGECKANLERFQKANSGKVVLTKAQMEQVQLILESFRSKVMEHPNLQQLFFGVPEHCFYWTDPDTGILCKAKPDLLTNIGICTDLKTTKDARANNFSRDIATYQYHVSAAFYLDGIKAVLEKQTGTEFSIENIPDVFSIVAIETDAPYEIQCHALSDPWIEQGRKLYKKALQRYKTCMDSGVWEGYPRELNVLQMPNYLIYKEGDE